MSIVRTAEISKESLLLFDRRLRAFIQCQDVLLQALKETELYQEVCRIAVKTGGYRSAWIGLVESDEDQTVTPIASAGFEVEKPAQLRETRTIYDCRDKPACRAIHTGVATVRRHILSDPRYESYRRTALEQGYASSIALPMICGTQALGVLNIYAPEPDAFDVDEAALLQRLADNLAVAVFAIRTHTYSQRAKRRQDLSLRVLQLINTPSSMVDTVHEVLVQIMEFSGVEAVGIRLRNGQDFPYYETKGFPPEFVDAEKYLCATDDQGQLIRDSKGNPRLECMCGNVIRGRTNPSFPFFTSGGSFWTNSKTRLLAELSKEDRKVFNRNRCNGEDYESVALIPLRSGNEIIGLLQLNDRRTDMFTAEEIGFYEGVGNSIGIAMERKLAEQDLHIINSRLAAEQKALKEANIAMKEVLARVESDKKESLLRVQSNVDRIVMPLLRKLKAGADESQSNYISLMMSNLAEITSPFISKLEARYAQLSPREVEICKMIKDGLSSKEIATDLNTAEGTVRNQRKSIRKKLGIANNKINLSSFLKTV